MVVALTMEVPASAGTARKNPIRMADCPACCRLVCEPFRAMPYVRIPVLMGGGEESDLKTPNPSNHTSSPDPEGRGFRNGTGSSPPSAMQHPLHPHSKPAGSSQPPGHCVPTSGSRLHFACIVSPVEAAPRVHRRKQARQGRLQVLGWAGRSPTHRALWIHCPKRTNVKKGPTGWSIHAGSNVVEEALHHSC